MYPMKFLKSFLFFVLVFFLNNSFAQTTISFGVSANPICAGTGVTFTAQVTNCASPQYQWYLNSVPIPLATNPTYFSNSLNNGDVINVTQTNGQLLLAHLPRANSKTMTVYTLPSLTLLSTAGTTNQTVCQNDDIDPIKYNVVGSNITMSISGLPTGLNTSFVGGIYKIFGATSQLGTFNYTLTASTSSCGQVQQNGSFNINQKIIPILIPGTGSSTTISTFNGSRIYS